MTITEIAAREGVSIGTVDLVIHYRGHVEDSTRKEKHTFYNRRTASSIGYRVRVLAYSVYRYAGSSREPESV